MKYLQRFSLCNQKATCLEPPCLQCWQSKQHNFFVRASRPKSLQSGKNRRKQIASDHNDAAGLNLFKLISGRDTRCIRCGETRCAAPRAPRGWHRARGKKHSRGVRACIHMRLWEIPEQRSANETSGLIVHKTPTSRSLPPAWVVVNNLSLCAYPQSARCWCTKKAGIGSADKSWI